jgi:hypothetical protein
MKDSNLLNRQRLDRFGILLSGLCALHCIATIAIVSGLGLGAQFLLAEEIHHYGLAAAAVVAAMAIGAGVWIHRRLQPFAIAATGLAFMGAALASPHGIQEAALTIIGVALVSVGHFMNLRSTH